MPSMAFAQSTQARLPHVPANRRSLDDAADFAHAADRPVAPPRFDPGLSTGPGSFATGDPGVSPDRTLTGWLSRACARLRHVRSLAFMAPELLDARGSRPKGEPCTPRGETVHMLWSVDDIAALDIAVP